MYLGQTFGLPVNTSTRAMYYNKSIFEEAGVASPPETWDELLTVGQSIGEAGYAGFGLQGGNGLETNTYFYYFVWGNGGDLYDSAQSNSALNSPEAVEALGFMQTLIEEGATQDNVTSDDYNRRAGLEADFMDGELAMVISGPWFIGRLRNDVPDLDFGVAPIPYNTTPATYGVIDTIVMTRTSQHKDQAWEFLQFLYEDERRLAYHTTGGFLPETSAVAENPVFSEDEDFAVFLSLLPDARFEPLHIQSEIIAQAVIDAVREVYLEEKDPQTALSDAVMDIDGLLRTAVAGW